MFNNARLKLTAWYLVIIMLISIFFSTVIYQVLTREIERFAFVQKLRIERELIHERELLEPDLRLQFPPPKLNIDPDLVKESKKRVILILFLVNGTILIFSGLFGYLLAGKTLKPIKNMVDEQNRFISDASHELKTPLTALKTTMEIFLRNKKQTINEAKMLISDNILEVDKLHTLSEELLQLSQYQKPNGNMKFEDLSLTTLIKDSIHKIEPLAKQRAIIVINETTDHYHVLGNKYSLTDLFVILLDNAVKYSQDNSKIIVKSEKIDRYTVIQVVDKGIGIDKKDVPHIFDRFYRADSARTKKKVNGYGLGLSIAKKIVNLHKGSIDLESQLGKGSVFTVKLPIFS
jgi:two-component system, OmpR family, sensor histidine kinase CiaH